MEEKVGCNITSLDIHLSLHVSSAQADDIIFCQTNTIVYMVGVCTVHGFVAKNDRVFDCCMKLY